jgi:transcriptional regulator with GAF, ATPase, and Fis domain
MDENEFFRQAALMICGNLEIEVAMATCLQYMRPYIPVDRMFLQVNEPSLGAIRTIATATGEGGRKVDLLTPMNKAARDWIQRRGGKKADEIVVIDSEQTNPVAMDMLRFHGIQGSSVLRMPLITGSRRIGGIVLTAEGADRYKQEHVRLLGLLKEPFTIALANTLKHRELIRLRDRLADDNKYLNRELQRLTGDEIVGTNFGLRHVMSQVRQVAPTDSPVLLTGETGVGKDVVANTIHYSSSRSEGPFVTVNCGAIPDTLIDSELFGHEKGAFTGALSQKRGRFERADKGTIFLDEIGELPPQAQVRLLRVFQNKEIERVGGTKTITLDIRIIAATNRNLEEMVKEKRFREDLWFRLNVFPIQIPPLCERKMDIPALVQHFISMKAGELKLPDIPKLSPGTIDALMEYRWPGNVRELQNVIERALILNPGGPLTFENLNQGKPKKSAKYAEEGQVTENLNEVISRHIRRILSKTNGKVNGPDGAAALLGINPSTLRNRMKKLGVSYGRKGST